MDINQIVEELIKNDYSHFDEFYQLTSRQIYFSAITILNDHALAEDILQDTYLSFLSNILQYKKGHNIYAYLSVIARNLSINLYHKRNRTVQNEDYINTTIADDPYGNSRIQSILNLLDQPIEKEIVTYHTILEYKFIDISKIVQKPLGTVLWIYNKAIKKLKERLGETNEN